MSRQTVTRALILHKNDGEPMNRLDGKTAIITGGARGQGAAEAALFVAAGGRVVITDVDVELGQDVAAKIGESCLFLPQDVASESDWQRVVEHTVEHFGSGTFWSITRAYSASWGWRQLRLKPGTI